MSFLHAEDKQSSLSRGVLGVQVESPGSSVFDLPTQLPNSAQLERKPTILAEALKTALSGTTNTSKNAAPRFLVISGGTGGNSICSAFGDACYVLPVSDDGGSSSEIIRVLGGPSIGNFVSICFERLAK